jgi:anthranilate synthase component 1
MVAKAPRTTSRAGDIFQVVLSQRFEAPFDLPPFALYRALRRVNPSPFLYYLDFEAFPIAGSSPEILVRVRDGKVTIRPIAGTRPRGATPAEDQALADELLADPKERAEHLMLLDLGRNDVGRVAEIGTVKVTDRSSSSTTATSCTSSRTSKAALRKHDALDALPAASRPAPSRARRRCAPWRSSTNWRRRSRGIYAGCVGYFSRQRRHGHLHHPAHGRSSRTADVRAGRRRHRRRFSVNPASEQLECINKAKALFKAAEEAVRFAARSREGTVIR